MLSIYRKLGVTLFGLVLHGFGIPFAFIPTFPALTTAAM
jgi:hypothetical protein